MRDKLKKYILEWIEEQLIEEVITIEDLALLVRNYRDDLHEVEQVKKNEIGEHNGITKV